MAVSMTISAAVADFGGRGRLLRPGIVLQQEHAEKLFTGVNDTADKFFGGVSDTGD